MRIVGPQTVLAQLFAHLLAVQAGQHNVEDAHVWSRSSGSSPQPSTPIVGDVTDVSIALGPVERLGPRQVVSDTPATRMLPSIPDANRVRVVCGA